eukprot:TRINITY_DN279_c0_g2_i3.p2 TRINITY_DN279_c0_g2~~TRINITY_DN279_c0_g2_i3.p2  ORF type:complete len:197 (+),score=71.69 TRINITY_DN279_c0_g2_i3:57-593(+)
MWIEDEGKSRWEACRAALELLAPACCKADPDGVKIFFFSNTIEKEDHVKDAKRIKQLFSKYEPDGSTDLASVLLMAFDEHFTSGGKPETMLVITDGCPDDTAAVEGAIVECTQRLRDDDELSVSFIQVGKDPDARGYLKHLDNGLVDRGAKFDIVDTKTFEQLKGLSFVELIFKSLTS